MSRTDSTQYAYQRAKSTEAALHNLVQKIEGSLNQKEFVLGVFLDINLIMRPLDQWMQQAASMGLFLPCVGGLMPFFAVKAFKLRSGKSVSGYS
jgi:hypothetical protein